jgi:hypothetical protein
MGVTKLCFQLHPVQLDPQPGARATKCDDTVMMEKQIINRAAQLEQPVVILYIETSAYKQSQTQLRRCIFLVHVQLTKHLSVNVLTPEWDMQAS